MLLESMRRLLAPISQAVSHIIHSFQMQKHRFSFFVKFRCLFLLNQIFFSSTGIGIRSFTSDRFILYRIKLIFLPSIIWQDKSWFYFCIMLTYHSGNHIPIFLLKYYDVCRIYTSSAKKGDGRKLFCISIHLPDISYF